MAKALLVSRRQTLSTGLALAAGAVTAGAATGGARPVRAAAAPVVLTLVPNLNFPQWPITPQDFQMLREQALGPFLARNPSIRVELFPNTSVLAGLGGATMAAMLAGDGPDVFADWVAPPFIENDLVLDISDYIRQDNVDMNEFLSGQLAYYKASALYSPTNPNGWYMLPGYLNTSALVVNLTIVDQLGLKRPEPGWTWQDWTQLWRAVTVPAKQQYGGTDLWTGYDFSYNGVSPYILHGFGGGYVDPRNTARCYLDAPGSIAGGEWFYGLVADKVIPVGGSGGTQVTWNATTGNFTAFVRWNGFDWDYFPFPVWPVRPATWGATDFYAIWKGTRHPDAAWLLLKAISVERPWQYFITRVLLMGPAQRSLWQDWAAILRQAAPALVRKNLQGAFVEPVLRDEVWVGTVLRYATEQAASIIGKYQAAIVNRQVSVPAGFAAAARQVDALEAEGPVLSGQVAALLRTFQKEIARAQASAGPILYPAPPTAGIGNPGSLAPSLLRVGPAGRYTVSGSGSGGVHGPGDAGTFAAGPARLSRASFTCRLLAVGAGGAALPRGAKAGLMARGSLTDAAAAVFLNVTFGGVAAPGVHFETRSVAATNVSDQKPGAPGGAGLLAASGLLRPGTGPLPNALLRPIWLRLVLDVDRWTAYTSLDGKTWLQAGTTTLAEMAGAWVGLFVTSHAPGVTVVASFDDLAGFTPTTVVRFGAA